MVLTYDVYAGGGKVTLSETAHLLLFEYPHDICNAARDNNGAEPDLFLTGMLIRTVTFPAGTSFETVLEVNELLRYLTERWRENGSRQWMADGFAHFLPQKPLPDGCIWKASEVGPGSVGSGGMLIHWDSWLALPVAAGLHQKACGCNTPAPGAICVQQFAPDAWSFRLMPDEWLNRARKRVDEAGRPAVDWLCHADDRGYTWTHYCAYPMDWQMQRESWPGASKGDEETAWIRLLNVDKVLLQGEGDAASPFEREWAAGLTYRRWLHAGTRYGFTSHSGALLATQFDGFPLHEHFAMEYFDHALLLLYVRTILLRFSRRLSELSATRKDARDSEQAANKRLGEQFDKLRRDLMLFTNLYRFPQLSNQQQSQEMYQLMLKASGIDNLYKEVETEVHSSEEFLGSLAQGEETSVTTKLTQIATAGLCLTVLMEGLREGSWKTALAIAGALGLFCIAWRFLKPNRIC